MGDAQEHVRHSNPVHADIRERTRHRKIYRLREIEIEIEIAIEIDRDGDR